MHSINTNVSFGVSNIVMIGQSEAVSRVPEIRSGLESLDYSSFERPREQVMSKTVIRSSLVCCNSNDLNLFDLVVFLASISK